MIRKNFYLTSTQDKWLVANSEKEELSEAELLRRILDYTIASKDVLDIVMYRG